MFEEPVENSYSDDYLRLLGCLHPGSICIAWRQVYHDRGSKGEGDIRQPALGTNLNSNFSLAESLPSQHLPPSWFGRWGTH